MNNADQPGQPVGVAAIGSYFVGGRNVDYCNMPLEEYVLAPNGVPVQINPNGTTSVGHMYVQYVINAAAASKPAVVFCHGGSMTGAVWESTPDGRSGWMSDFLTRGWSVYNVDAVERGRAGWAPREEEFCQRALLRTHQDTFTQFRLGSRVSSTAPDSLKAAAYPNCQFPLEAFGQFMKQIVPRWAGSDKLTLAAYIAMLEGFEQPVILVAHSQGGSFAFRAAEQVPEKVAAIVAIEPAQGGTTAGIENGLLNDIPVLVVYGDHLDLDARWPEIRKKTDGYFQALNAAGGSVEVMDLPDIGIYGNSHLPMLEYNNHCISALIDKWLVGRLL